MPHSTDDFPFARELSFESLIEFWRELSVANDSSKAKFARKIVSRIEKVPELQGAIADITVLDDHKDLVAELMSAVFPFARWDDWYMGAIPPFQLESFYSTLGFKRLGFDNPDNWFKNLSVVGAPVDPSEMIKGRVMSAFHFILQSYYEYDAEFTPPLVFTFVDPSSGLATYYKVHIDTRFVSCRLNGPLPNLDPTVIEQLLQNPKDFETWAAHLPPHLFTISGFAIVTLVDVTTNEIHSLIKNTLLRAEQLTNAETIESIEGHLRSLLKQPDLQIGILGLNGATIDDLDSAKVIGRSLIMSGNELPACPSRKQSVYADVFTATEPIVISNLDSCAYSTGFEYKLRSQDFHSLILAPLRYNGNLVGILEIGSSKPNSLSTFFGFQLSEIFSLFASAMHRSFREYEDRLAAIVKRQFTAIHPSVEWRFRKAAENFVASEANDEQAEFESIAFSDVYPLYGLSDIRDSSVTRNRAIQDDLLSQLGMALSIIVEASSFRPLPALDELGFRISEYAGLLESELSSDTEVNAVEFLRRDVEPLFDQLATFGDPVGVKIDEYRSELDPKLGVLYKRRKDYETSVNLINDSVSTFLEKQDTQAQTMFPHYFEKYKTDGVDYNIYIGDSIAETAKFDLLYLRNMRLWQLITMCGIVWELELIEEQLPIKLKAAHLILVQDVPISVRFRSDEKKFDVDGAYNARYEIVKKRIDKAVEKRTGIRITQPGFVTIVYSQAKEGNEYRRYLEYLRAAGYIDGATEELDLEDLQGVNGMKAFRVKVSPVPPDMETRSRPEVVMSLANNHGDGDSVKTASPE